MGLLECTKCRKFNAKLEDHQLPWGSALDLFVSKPKADGTQYSWPPMTMLNDIAKPHSFLHRHILKWTFGNASSSEVLYLLIITLDEVLSTKKGVPFTSEERKFWRDFVASCAGVR